MNVDASLYIEAENEEEAIDKALRHGSPDNVMPIEWENISAIIEGEAGPIDFMKDSIRIHISELIQAQDFDPSLVETQIESCLNQIEKIYGRLTPSGEHIQ